MKIRTKSDGFSLIEVAIGLLIIGLIIGPEIDYYAAWKNRQVVDFTVGNANTSMVALKKYVLNNGCYPVPAAPGVNSTAAGAGVEVVPLGGRTDCTDLTGAQLAAIPACAGNDTVVCKTPCSGATVNCVGGNPAILIGEVPWATLGLPKQYAVDGFGRKLTYAISSNLTGITAFDQTKGAISVADINGNSGAGGATPGPETNDHFAIVSHGKDGLGGFSIEGVLNGNCAAVGADTENCDNDGLFANGFAVYNDIKGVPQYNRQESTVAGATHFDDFVYYASTLSSDIWTKTTQAGSVGDIVSNNNAGNIKVTQPLAAGGPSAPQAKLDVRGDLAADELWAADLCDTSGNSYAAPTYTNKPCQLDNVLLPSTVNGFAPTVIASTPPKTQQAGNGIHCGTVTTGDGVTTNGTAGNPMAGIASADEECTGMTNVKAPAAYNIGVCPPGGGGAAQFPYGIDGAGNLLCSTAPHP